MPSRKVNIDGDIGDNTDTASIGLDNKQFIQYFGNLSKDSTEGELASLLSLALFGNDKIDFNGVITEIRQLKLTNKQVYEKLESLKRGQENRESNYDLLQNQIKNLENELEKLRKELHDTIRNKPTTIYHVIFYIFLVVGSLSSIVQLFN